MQESIKQYIEENSIPEPNTGCWLWSLSCPGFGYGRAKRNIGTSRNAHKLSYEGFFDEAPKGICVCHKCDTPACVNPDHLFLGTLQDNNKDRDAKGRQAKGDMFTSRTTSEQAAKGDRHGSKTKPHRIARGERSGMFGNPKNVNIGDKNGSRTQPEKLMRGEDVFGAKLKEEDVPKIRKMSIDGISKVNISKIFNVSATTISFVVSKKTWKHVK